MAADLYLRANLAMKEQPAPPVTSVAIDNLIKMAHTMQDTGFQWCFFDKPRGTCNLASL